MPHKEGQGPPLFGDVIRTVKRTMWGPEPSGLFTALQINSVGEWVSHTTQKFIYSVIVNRMKLNSMPLTQSAPFILAASLYTSIAALCLPSINLQRKFRSEKICNPGG